ncbi:hypothetical protein [Maribacter sp. MAR_2009_72]|uniref:hypothetical protein n=1 Tax=Maribacter sp. MAR_2009_72 TaxID=1250050 RepID=UPI00119ADD65|nr:hypothetical protein [Maribacter sp. MAR_2009_72]TVZ16484.1 zincin-like metallopeptidase toxin 3 of polymorphic toxin system [Maribacter sp. MAR_2009_72]
MTNSEFIDVNLYKVIATNVTTTKLSGGNFYINNAGQQCSIKITTKIVYIDGNSVLVTEYSGCDDSPRQKTACSITTASSDCPDGDDGEVAVFNRATVRNIKKKLDLEYYTPEFDWISSNHAEADRLNNFIKDHTVNGVLDSLAKEFGLKALEAWMDGYSVISITPLVKYPVGSDYDSNYKKLTEYLKNQLPTLANNTAIVNAFKEYTNATTEQIEQILKWGDGPEIVIKQLESVSGHFSEPNTLEIDIDLINNLENSVSGSTYSESLLFFIAVTILHEAVHYGDFKYNNDYWTGNYPYTNEEGWRFENQVYGGAVIINEEGEITIVPLN